MATPRSLLFALAALSCASCNQSQQGNQPSNEQHLAPDFPDLVKRVTMAGDPPVPLESLDSVIVAKCQIDLEHWRRTYGNKWLPAERRFSGEQIAFLIQQGPYKDLMPGREWRDLGDVLNLDDRPNIELISGTVNIRTMAVTFDLGRCSNRPLIILPENSRRITATKLR